MSAHHFEKSQVVKVSVAEMWAFISNPQNLKLITPPEMGFEIVSENLPKKMHAGMVIEHRVRPLLGIPMTWVSEITEVVEGHYFIDEQRKGPYKTWRHKHILEEHPDGVLLIDQVSYEAPLSFLGDIANSLFIKSKLEEVFAFRVKAIDKLYC